MATLWRSVFAELPVHCRGFRLHRVVADDRVRKIAQRFTRWWPLSDATGLKGHTD
jgi:hypothetical protein